LCFSLVSSATGEVGGDEPEIPRKRDKRCEQTESKKAGSLYIVIIVSLLVRGGEHGKPRQGEEKSNKGTTLV